MTIVRPLRWVLAVVFTLVAMLALAAQSASAHDTLVSSTPAADEVVTTELAQVALTFNEAPLPGAPSLIQIVDPAGTTVSDGNADVSGNTVSTAFTPSTNGAYQVTWQTVSADGHTISGLYAFTYNGPLPTPSPSSEPTVTSTPSPEASAPPTVDASDSDPGLIALLVGIGVLLGLTVAVYLVRRNKPGNTA